jgi:hypothetical protein
MALKKTPIVDTNLIPNPKKKTRSTTVKRIY